MHTGMGILIFLIFCLLLGALLRLWLRATPIPYSVGLLVAGLLIGLAGRSPWLEALPAVDETLKLVAHIDPHLILFLFLPALIFESALGMEVHLFRRLLPQVAILAVPGLLIATGLTALVAQWLFPWDWGWIVALMFGALISATDPVAVVALLREMSSRKRLETLLEGESLLNDGTAIVLFALFSMLLAQGSASVNGLAILGQFVWVVCVGSLVGWAMAKLAFLWIRQIFNDSVSEIVVTIAGAYLAFILAELGLAVSGIVAVLTMALLFAGEGRTTSSGEATEYLHRFWSMLAYLFNTIIFLMVGIVVGSLVTLDDPSYWLMLALFYPLLQLIRAASVLLLVPVLSRVGIGISRNKATVLIWGGLRGAVALVMALSVAQSPLVPSEIGDQVLFLTAGIVVLSIVINGTTAPYLLRYLGLDRLPAAKQTMLNKAELSIQWELDALEKRLREERHLQRADWERVDRTLSTVQFVDPQVPPEEELPEDVKVAFMRRLLESERKHYWNQFEEGVLTPRATEVLVAAVEQALDDTPELSPRHALHAYWNRPLPSRHWRFLPWLGRLMVRRRFEHLCNSYNSARGFVTAQNDLLHVIDSFAFDESLNAQMREQVQVNRTLGEAQILHIRQRHPDIATQLETYTVSRLLLHRERETIQRLLHEGVLDAPEAERMSQRIDQAIHRLDRQSHLL